MQALRTVTLSLALLGSGLALAPADARACGGCFAPPGAAQVVTDHRMVLSLSTAQTTLWDQFQYSGSPEDFSWILPIRYTDRTRVQLASDDFLQLMTNVSVAALATPNPPPWPPGCNFPVPETGGFADAAAVSDAASARDTGVTVLREEVVGPYAVAILRGTSGMGLREWLTMNGYAIPAALQPTLDYYVGLSMDFVALRLRAGKGLNRMVPVRVTVDGYQARLPLRMIAAGVADRVGVALTVFAPSRVEAMNFPNVTFADSDFTYDWSAPPPDNGRVFLDAFNARNRAMGERLWLTESAMRQELGNLSNLARFFPRRGGFGGPDAGPMMSVATAVDDVRVAFEGLGDNAVVTRMRADLPAPMLDRDLDLAASDLGLRDRAYRFGRELHRPMYAMCPFPTAGADASVPDDLGAASDAGVTGDAGAAPVPTESSGGAQCAVSLPGARTSLGGALAVGLALAALAARRRRS